jgi:hypothetical protein
VKVYRRHCCERSHRTYRTLAKCIWRRAAWIAGEGPFALLAWCRALTVTLHATHDDALEAKRTIDLSACGGRCTGRHEIIRLDRGRGDTDDHRASVGLDIRRRASDQGFCTTCARDAHAVTTR